MIVDKAFIKYLSKGYHMNIPKELEDFLLEEYGEEPFPNEYSEQDLYEQIRKMEMNYHKGLLNITLRGPELLLKQRYETLKDEYIDAMHKVRSLEDEVENLKKLLQKQEVNNFGF